MSRKDQRAGSSSRRRVVASSSSSDVEVLDEERSCAVQRSEASAGRYTASKLDIEAAMGRGDSKEAEDGIQSLAGEDSDDDSPVFLGETLAKTAFGQVHFPQEPVSRDFDLILFL